MAITYKDSGVDIERGEETVNRIKPLVRATHNDKVLSDIGLFGGFYDAKFEDYKHPVLVASTDGVGTKLKIAFLSNKHDSIGHCLVNHCVNDILSCGAKPLFFLDYFATGKLNPDVAENVIKGFTDGCLENGCALIGGETAEMPSIYSDGEYDVSGTIIGVVDKQHIVNGKNILPGDVIIGLESSGLHTNGYSLARKVLLEKYSIGDEIDGLNSTLGEALLSVHRSYLKEVHPLVLEGKLTGISHITGGGLEGNTNRIIPEGMKLNVNWNSWQIPALFDLIQKTGDISDEEMRHVFNLGIGMALVARPEYADEILSRTKHLKSLIIGEILSR